MKRILKWLGVSIATLVVIVGIGVAYVYLASQHAIDRQHYIPFKPISIKSNAESIERGKRLATITGCYNSCHGKEMEGMVLFDEPGIARINAPNLTRVLREYSDPELVRLLRHGVKRDGTTTWLMPSQMFAYLSEQDMNDIVAFVRSQPERDGVMREVNIQARGRLGIVLGKLPPIVPQIDHARTPIASVDRSDAMKYGEYLVMTTCTECHGQDLKGAEMLKAPDLLVTQAYSEEAFFHLMRTGIGLGNRKLGLMTEVGETRFPSFTDDELKAIRLYLNAYARKDQSLAATAQASANR